MKVKDLKWCPSAERAGQARAVGRMDLNGQAYALIHYRYTSAKVTTPQQARKIAAWLNEWADALEREVQP